ncbi:MAG: amino acid ABC transporter ATP-binding protein [Pirellulales bacterium]|nr:amino acid ABC transporter ATP-binding protein [Pirellulales bacterium]
MTPTPAQPDDRQPLLRLCEVAKRYGSRSILDGVSLDVARGETVTIIGPSGGGKSTLLRCITALHRFDAGSIEVGPHVFTAGKEPPSDAVRAARLLVGMIFQDFQLFPHLTALDNVTAAPRYVLGLDARAARERGLALLERVGLADRATAYPAQLSGGQKQRVAIARALAMQPQGLLCDEITSSLDPELKGEVLDVLLALREQGISLLMVTHEIGFARRAADRVVVLAGGQIIEAGPPGEVLDHPQTERTRQFLERVF